VNTSSPLIAEMKDKKYRDGYIAAQIALGLPSKIRALRVERKWTQGELARLAKMAQPRISEIETPGERKLNLDTLQRIASAFDIGLEVNFVPFGELIEHSEGFDPDSFSVKSFDVELTESLKAEETNRKVAKWTSSFQIVLGRLPATTRHFMEDMDRANRMQGDNTLRAALLKDSAIGSVKLDAIQKSVAGTVSAPGEEAVNPPRETGATGTLLESNVTVQSKVRRPHRNSHHRMRGPSFNKFQRRAANG
jgi:transcriptional regulator with XRE-family HTH domain